MKKILTVALALGLCISMAGCGKDDEEKSFKDEAVASVVKEAETVEAETIPSTSTDEEKDIAKEDNTEAAATVSPFEGGEYSAFTYEGSDTPYYKIIETVYSAIVNKDQDAMAGDGFTGLFEPIMYNENALDNLGYALMDLSGDGIAELIITEPCNYLETTPLGGRMVYSVYSVKDGEPVLVFEGWYRNRYSLLIDNTFFNEGSGGAAYACAGNFYLSEDGTQLLCNHFYFTSPKPENSDVSYVFYNQTGDWDTETSVEIGPDSAENNIYSFMDIEYAEIQITLFKELSDIIK